MSRILKRIDEASDDAFGWIGIALVLIASITLDKGSSPHKWHAGIVWTFVAFFGLLIFGRKNRKSWLFWVFWATCLVLHVFTMWLIFGQLLPRLIVGTLYVIPFAIIESMALASLYSRLGRKLASRSR
jgi:fatty acid desaturase